MASTGYDRILDAAEPEGRILVAGLPGSGRIEVAIMLVRRALERAVCEPVLPPYTTLERMVEDAAMLRAGHVAYLGPGWEADPQAKAILDDHSFAFVIAIGEGAKSDEARDRTAMLLADHEAVSFADDWRAGATTVIASRVDGTAEVDVEVFPPNT